VGPRDWLADRAAHLTAEDKGAAHRCLSDPAWEIEVGSFLQSPAVPQMADSEEVVNP